jgi:hypothetical protein
MIRAAVTFSILLCLIYPNAAQAGSQDTRNRGSYTRGGFCGAKYISFGNSAEACADDVFAIYWNPAGLASLRKNDSVSADVMRAKAEKGDLTGISEKDVRDFGGSSESVWQMGISGSSISIDRNAGFGGAAFTTGIGSFGAGVYTIYSGSIDEYNENAERTGASSYSGAEGIISYARSISISSIGISVKGLHETISDASFAGAACDIGVQASPFPFIKIGVVAQDLGIGLYPVSGDNLEKTYDRGSPTLRSSVMMESRSSGVSVSGGIVRHIEQRNFIYNAGIRYSPSSHVALSLGYFDKDFSVGAGAKIWKLELWYAFSYDRIGMGYNHTVSLSGAL